MTQFRPIYLQSVFYLSLLSLFFSLIYAYLSITLVFPSFFALHLSLSLSPSVSHTKRLILVCLQQNVNSQLSSEFANNVLENGIV